MTPHPQYSSYLMDIQSPSSCLILNNIYSQNELVSLPDEICQLNNLEASDVHIFFPLHVLYVHCIEYNKQSISHLHCIHLFILYTCHSLHSTSILVRIHFKFYQRTLEGWTACWSWTSQTVNYALFRTPFVTARL